MRSYGQYCAVAKALDVIGDRWNLLIVRELLIRGPSRYTDLLSGLPGIATNLLADRLRALEEAGVVRREEAPPPIATTLFELTERGDELRPIILELGRWGAPLMAERGEQDAFRTHWMAALAGEVLEDSSPQEPPIAIEVRTGDESMVIETTDGAVRTRLGSAESPDLVLSGAPQLIIGLLAGRLTVADARAEGLRYEGSLKALRRLTPAAAAAAA
jgi:DNA-binding HxlR family transcriptional regulator